MVQIRRVGKKSFKLYIFALSNVLVAPMMLHPEAMLGVNRSRALIKGVVPGANGLHMGSTGQVSDNEVVFITVRRNGRDVECQLTSSTLVDFLCQVRHERPVVGSEEH